MNQKAAYEMTITEKLEQLTVPDKVDAIWARIETQLDIDMPTDEGASDPSLNPSSGNGLWNIAIIVFIAALIAIIYFTNKKTNTNNNIYSPDTKTIITSPGNTNDKPPPERNFVPAPQQKPPVKNVPIPLPVYSDSLPTVSDGAGVPFADSVVNNPVPSPVPVVNDPVDTSKKKNRGVKGIKDSDYRITPKKDSTE